MPLTWFLPGFTWVFKGLEYQNSTNFLEPNDDKHRSPPGPPRTPLAQPHAAGPR